MEKLKEWAGRLKREAIAVYFAARDSRTPIGARVVAMAVAAYAFSPVDLVPDFIPVIGYLDDLVIVPLGLLLVVRMIPPEVLEDARIRASRNLARPKSYVAAVLIVSVWVISAVVIVGVW